MSKKTRKGIKIGIPHLIEGWYEQIIEEFRKDVRKRSEKRLFRHSKAEGDIARRFRDFLSIAERNIEMQLWFAMGFAINNELGKGIDYELHSLFGRLIGIFNNINLRFDPSNLSEDLLNHLKLQLKQLEEQSQRLWDIQSCNPAQDGKERAKKLIDDFNRNLYDFANIMDPYMKSRTLN